MCHGRPSRRGSSPMGSRSMAGRAEFKIRASARPHSDAPAYIIDQSRAIHLANHRFLVRLLSRLFQTHKHSGATPSPILSFISSLTSANATTADLFFYFPSSSSFVGADFFAAFNHWSLVILFAFFSYAFDEFCSDIWMGLLPTREVVFGDQKVEVQFWMGN